jgi:fructose-bisphosphate aldolase class II
VDHGVIKMNIDTDTQYAFTRPAAAHMFTHYDGVLKVDGEVGNKKAYDPAPGASAPRPAWPSASSTACEDLRSSGTTLGAKALSLDRAVRARRAHTARPSARTRSPAPSGLGSRR